MSSRTSRRTRTAAGSVAGVALGAALLLPAGAAQAVEACAGKECVKAERPGKGNGRTKAPKAAEPAPVAVAPEVDDAPEAVETTAPEPEPVETTVPPEPVETTTPPEPVDTAPAPVGTTAPAAPPAPKPAGTTAGATAPAPATGTTRPPGTPTSGAASGATRAPAPTATVRATAAATARAQERLVRSAAEQRRARAALTVARAEVGTAQRAAAAADTPAERARAGERLAAATNAVDAASTRVERTTAAVAEAKDGVAQVNVRRAKVGLSPISSSPEAAAAAVPSGSPSPVSGGAADAATDRTAQAVSDVEDVMPGRNTGLLVALVGGIVALLVLVAREFIR